MDSAPSVVLVGNGQLKQARRALLRLRADFVHLRENEVVYNLPGPRDLLITTCQMALMRPDFEWLAEDATQPIWICMHNQDFLPLRERLRRLGVHFLVHSGIDEESLRLLFGQFFHQGAERRGTLRLPFGREISCRVGREPHKAMLVELSANGCQIIGSSNLPVGAPIALDLPPELVGGSPIEFVGRVLRSVPCGPPSPIPEYSVAIDFDHLAADVRAQLERILDGRRLGTTVAPLERLPESVDELEAGSPEHESSERRKHTRHEYRRAMPLASAELDRPDVVLGRDLSLEGIRIEARADLGPGSRITLALHGAPREEPLVLEAEVVRDHGEHGLGLQFVSMPPEQTRKLEKLIQRLPPLESLRDADSEGKRLVISQLVRSSS